MTKVTSYKLKANANAKQTLVRSLMRSKSKLVQVIVPTIPSITAVFPYLRPCFITPLK
jgi:hypothetical protein